MTRQLFATLKVIQARIRGLIVLLATLLGVAIAPPLSADDLASALAVQTRMSADAAAGRPLVAHVVVALCDNESQGIVPVPPKLGDGDNPRSNLYWGALYGVKTYFSRHENWQRVPVMQATEASILERVAFHRSMNRNDETVDAYVIAEAWRGQEIAAATRRFLELTADPAEELLTIGDGSHAMQLASGGAAHVIAYVGHNGLMDFASPVISNGEPRLTPASAIVLACQSRAYFQEQLSGNRTHTLLTTNGLMAPEAYTLEAALSAWFAGLSANEVKDAAAAAYAQYQKANVSWAQRLFAAEP